MLSQEKFLFRLSVKKSVLYVRMELCECYGHIFVFLTGFEFLSSCVLCVLVIAQICSKLGAGSQILPMSFSAPEIGVMTEKKYFILF